MTSDFHEKVFYEFANESCKCKCQNRALFPNHQTERGMKKQLVARSRLDNKTKQKIVQLCFDAQSIGKFKPGLKMIFAMDDPPLFVKLEEVDQEPGTAVVQHS